MTIEKVTAFIVYWIAVFLAWLGGWSIQDAAAAVGMALGAGMFAVSTYYRRKTFQLLAKGQISQEVYERANR
ncbi:hypothetical protein NLN84_19015 [Citrobacter portucalensis]|uniref:hypothetical protein n=1 Tax=Citrobacter portucalensis TaxID=1639133 RepID=UPI00226B567F|nr:hypothetical protein [Citrobacter portucalensis]MCX9067667.1 hypothetical protein [Citrobacter portucalensis]MDN4386665.1 hypothetical protein [Citrobacter portucalensis]MDN4405969.1 hypothetical protein [Citrobacter portucalensis]MDN4446417.1 hypothetical protein [Citrobacter portucalensis]